MTLECPCDQGDIPREAHRMCAGNFVTGGVWVDSDTSQCEFDDLTFDLCSAVVCGITVCATVHVNFPLQGVKAVIDLLSDPTRYKTPEVVTLVTSIIEIDVDGALGSTSVS